MKVSHSIGIETVPKPYCACSDSPDPFPCTIWKVPQQTNKTGEDYRGHPDFQQMAEEVKARALFLWLFHGVNLASSLRVTPWNLNSLLSPQHSH